MGNKKRPESGSTLTKSKKRDIELGDDELDASLQAETKRRYLTYAMSVITSRALPDVRDGLKPVQRRILYAMSHDEHLYPDAKHRKSAKVVGTVIGKYHPHGDTAVYDAMVRMAQDFSMRMPLVDGSGNFGSLDGDGAAAYRYTECRLDKPAMELLAELKQKTVPLRDTYDGTSQEPVVLPAKYPNLLVNGSTGIAVGMATNIPPHNLREVTDACIELIDNKNANTTTLLKHIKGPDFPTGGQILNSKVELRQIYDSGSGPVKCRATYKTETVKKKTQIVITSIPYAITKSNIVEKIADIIIARKVPQLLDVRDESTDVVRIVLEIKPDVEPDKVMAYLFKYTPLQLNFNVNLTSLLPVPGLDIGQPKRTGIKEMLQCFVDFRFDTVKKRFQFELDQLLKRIHILEGFVTIFDALDETIRIIRKSDGKKDAAQKLIKRFKLDAVQVEAILELKLYKLAKLEINIIRGELEEKQKEAKRIQGILKSKAKLWTVVKNELKSIAEKLGNPRRTKTSSGVTELEFSDEDFILDEDAHVLVTKDGWIKRQREIKDTKKLRLREGDKILSILPGSTKEPIVLFSNFGYAYVTRINEIPASTGYGVPVQKLFKFKDKERVISAISLDPRLTEIDELMACSQRGYGLRFSVEPHTQVSSRAGRRFAKPSKGDEIVAVTPSTAKDTVVVATQNGNVLTCKAKDINFLEGAGKGVILIKVDDNDNVIGLLSSTSKKATMQLSTTSNTKSFKVQADPKAAKGRGGKGKSLVKRSKLMLADVPFDIPLLEKP